MRWILATAVITLLAPIACSSADDEPIVGPLLLYTERDAPSSTSETGDFETYLVAYDAGAAREISRWSIAARDVLVYPSVAADGAVVFVTGSSIEALYPLTNNRHTIATLPNLAQFSLAVSPDGTAIAFVEWDDEKTLAMVRVIELSTAESRTVMTFPRRQGSANEPDLTVRAWSADGQRLLLLGGSLDGGDGWWTSLSLDGEVTRLDAILARGVSPGARYLLMDGVNLAGCLLPEAQQVRLFDTEANSVVAEFADAERRSLIFAWSPDGSAALLRRPRVIDPGPGQCAPTFDRSASEFSLFSEDGVTPVPDVEALLREWHGDRLVQFACAPDGAPTRAWSSEECEHREQQIMKLNGQEVARADEIHVVGFIDVPAID